MSKIIGIDLGTSNTAAAVMEGGRPTIIPSAEGSSISVPFLCGFYQRRAALGGRARKKTGGIQPGRHGYGF